MDRTENESAEINQSESSDTENAAPDIKKAESIEKDLADSKSDGLDNDDGDATATNPAAKPLHNLKTDQPAEAAIETAELAAERADSDMPAVNGSGAHTDLAAEPESSDKDELDVEPAQEVSKEASAPQSNAEAQSKADDHVIETSKIDSQDTEDHEDPGFETEEQSPEAATSKTSIGKIAVSAVLITALFAGFFIFENKSKVKKGKTVAEVPSEDRPRAVKLENNQIVDIPSAITPGIYDDTINEVSILRDTLLNKQAEVIALKKRYRQSIEELEKEILDAQRVANVQTFLQATNHNRIVFSLKTIQRRQAYIRQLEKPLKWISGACEELLYLKRRVLTDLQVSAIASGIDMDGHVQQMHRALEEYRPTADKLAIDPTDAHLESLETLWQRIQDKQDAVSAEPAYSKNKIISAQICAGDFNRIGELSELTAVTAKCISEIQASDLFLNQITEISPGAARQLCQWKGSWICMNGIRALSPRVAHYLFQWDGNWISLNGLTDFPAEIGEALLRWRGRQLELMGLLDTADPHARIGIEYLAEWERSGGKLFVPESLRKKIDALHQQSG